MKHVKTYEKMSQKDMRNIVMDAIDVVRSYGVEVKFLDTEISGGAKLDKGYLYVSKDTIDEGDVDRIVSVLFHELGHFYCYDKGKFKHYHRDYHKSKLSESELKSIIRTAIRAEAYVDKWAKNEMKSYFPTLKFKSAYITKRDWVKKWILDYTYDAFEDRILHSETQKLIKLMDEMGI